MKAIKYVLVGAMMMGLSAPVMAQDVDFGTALAPISKALKADPNSKETMSLVKDYSKEFKKNPAALVALGNAFVGTKQYDKAVEMADLALKRNKNFGDAFILKGDVEAMKDEGGDAAMWYQQAMQLDPQNPTGYMRYASVYRKRDPQLAADALNKLRTILPDYPVDAEAAHSFYTAEKYDKAFEHFQKTKKESLDEYKLTEYALSAYMIDKKAESLELAAFGAQKFNKNIMLNRLALWNAVDLKKFAEGENYAKAVLACEGDKSARDYNYYGNALLGSQKWQEAITQFEEAMKVDPQNADPLGKISEAYTGLGQNDKALEYREMFMQKSSNVSPSDFAKLAGIYISDNKFDKALKVYDNMATKFPSIASWAYLMSAAAATKADPTEAMAVPYYQKIIDLLANKADRDADETSYLKSAYSGLGYYWYAKQNNLEKGKEYYQKVYELDPNDTSAKAVLGIEPAQ